MCPVSCSKSACTRRSRANSLHMRPWKACSLLCSRGPGNIQGSRGASMADPAAPFPLDGMIPSLQQRMETISAQAA